MTIAIFGASGFIGSKLVDSLLKTDNKLILFSKNPKHYSSDKITCLEGNFSNKKDIQKVFNQANVDAVIHLISTLIPSSNLAEYQNSLTIELMGTTLLLEALNHSNTKLIYLSSGGSVYGKNDGVLSESTPCSPINYYGLSKLQIEQLIETYSINNDLSYVILRPSNAYGPGQNTNEKQGLIGSVLYSALTQNPLSVYGDGHTKRDYIYIDDLITAIEKSLHNSLQKQTINIATGKRYTVNQVIEISEKIVGKKIQKEYHPKRSVDVSLTNISNDKMKQLFDWTPQTDLQTGIEKTYHFMKRNLSPTL